MTSRIRAACELLLGLVVLAATMAGAALLLRAFAPGVWTWIARNDTNGNVLFVITAAGFVVLIVVYWIIRVGTARLLLLFRRNDRAR